MHYDGYFGAIIFFLILQWVTALGRCGIRLFIVRKFGIDDIALLVTLIVSTGYDACFLAVQILTNGGQPNWEVDYDNLVPAINTTLGLLLMYILGTMCLKVALGLLLLRVLVKRWQVVTIYSLMTLSVVYNIFYTFFVLFECGNPKNFAMHMLVGQCLSRNAVDITAYIHSAITAAVDCAFAALPIVLIRKTDMSKRSKLSVAMILSLGSIGCICTIVRLAYVHTLTNPTITFFATTKPIGLLSLAEMAIGVTCISLSCYKPLFNKFFPPQTTYYYEDGTWHPHPRSDCKEGEIHSQQGYRGSIMQHPVSPHVSKMPRGESYELRCHEATGEVDWPL